MVLSNAQGSRSELTREEYEALVADLHSQNLSMRAGFSAYARTVRHHSLLLTQMESEINRLVQSNTEKNSVVQKLEKSLKTSEEVNGELRDQIDLLTSKVDILTEESLSTKARVQMTEGEKFDIDKEFLKAARAGKLRDVKVLLSKGADLEAKDQDNWTSLIYASCRGHLSVVESLLARGAMVNTKTKTKSTALMKAAKRNHLQIVRVLLANGANVELKTEKNATALMVAASFGNLSIVQSLLAAGARVDAVSSEGKTALDYASEEGHAAVVEILGIKGAEQ